jgi:hypothetical protein
MRILVVGDWHSELHEEAVFQAFLKLGHECHKFSWHEYFKPASRPTLIKSVEIFSKKFQNKYIFGPIINSINNDLILYADQHRPDIIFIYRGTHIKPGTLRTIKKLLPETVIMGYNNDDPFAQGHPFWLWRLFLASVPIYDMVLAYRIHNLEELKRAGAKRVNLLRSWYIPERSYPVQLSPEEQSQYGCDVAFIGHYERDWRIEIMEEIVKRGYKFKLYGPGYDWDPIIRKNSLLQSQVPVRLVWGEQYNKACCGAKIVLCFFSKLNRDTYTRRCFEIPATGTLLISEYSDDLASMFQEGVEADYFRSKEELLEKIKYYLGNDETRKSVSDAGLQRVRRDAHDVVSRMKQVLDWAGEIYKQEHAQC